MRGHVLTQTPYACASISYVHWLVFLNIFYSFLIFWTLNIWETQKLTSLCLCSWYIHVQEQDNLPSYYCFSALYNFLSRSLLGLILPGTRAPLLLPKQLKAFGLAALLPAMLSPSNVHRTCVLIISDFCSNVPFSVKASVTTEFTFQFFHYELPMPITSFICPHSTYHMISSLLKQAFHGQVI